MTKFTPAEKLEIVIDIYEGKGTFGLETIAKHAKAYGIADFTIHEGSPSLELTYIMFESMDDAKSQMPFLADAYFSYLDFDGGIAITTEEIEYAQQAA